MNILDELRQYKELKNITYQELAEMLGITYPTIYSWLNERRNVSEKNEAKIRQLLENEMRTEISIPLYALEQIISSAPPAQSLILELLRSNGSHKVSLLEKQIAQMAIGIKNLDFKILYGLSFCLSGKPYKEKKEE